VASRRKAACSAASRRYSALRVIDGHVELGGDFGLEAGVGGFVHDFTTLPAV
jgi:hypothetical protein